jgi:uncharacterized membrane protein YkvA (DUF1232 family)
MKEFMDKVKDVFTMHGLMGLIFMALAFGYGITSIDIIPDPIFLIGYVDDAIIVLLAFFVGTTLGKKVSGKKK